MDEHIWYSSVRANFTIACEVSRFPATSASRVRPIRTEYEDWHCPVDDHDLIEATEYRMGQQ